MEAVYFSNRYHPSVRLCGITSKDSSSLNRTGSGQAIVIGYCSDSTDSTQFLDMQSCLWNTREFAACGISAYILVRVHNVSVFVNGKVYYDVILLGCGLIAVSKETASLRKRL
jgi:hypothetical protein